VVQSLQSWLDQFASVKDFGAVGDGVTDDTAAINRALYQLFCREVNPQIRRSLFFPAGVYLVSDTINIPPYATLYGEGVNNSVITLVDAEGAVSYVAQTADSLQQTGVNIGSNGAIPPQFITINNLGFSSLDPLSSVFFVNDATNCRFQNTGFYGPLTTANLDTSANGTVGVEFASTPSLITSQITFDGCVFNGTVWGVNTSQQIQGITFANSQFDTLYNGVLLGTSTPVLGGPTGVRIVSNLFNNIYAEGIVFGDVSLNASGHNIFYDVGNHFTSSTGTPATAIISIQSSNNLSISDLFERSDNFATTFLRVDLNNTQSIATVNGSDLALGNYIRQSGIVETLVNNTTDTLFTVDADKFTAFSVNYTIVRDTDYRTGTILVATATTLTYSDDYVENTDTGVSISVSQVGTTVTVEYTTTDTGVPGLITYSITHLV
jgi:polygalacturonase